MVFTTRLSGGKGGRNAPEHELRRLGIRQKNGKPNHPQTQGKVERLQQALKKWLRASSPWVSQSSSASPTVYRRRGFSPASISLCSSRSLSRTSVLVLPCAT